MKKVLVFSLVLCMLFALAGCGAAAISAAPAAEPAASTPASAAAPEATAESAPEADAPAAESKGNILFAYFASGPYPDRMYEGMARVAEARGYNIEMQTTVGQDPAGLVDIVTDALSTDVDILLTSTSDSASLTPILKQYRDAGKTVITTDLDVMDPTARDAYAGLMDVPMMGDRMIHDMVEFVGSDDFQYAILEAPLTSEMSRLRTERMIAVAEENYPNLELVAIESGEGDPKVALAAAQNILAKYPDVKGIIANASENGVPVCQAIEQAGKLGQCWSFGQGAPAAMQAYFESGSAGVISQWDPADWGAWTAEIGIALFEGQTFEVGAIDAFEEFPEAEKLEDDVYFFHKLFTYTKDNVFDYSW